MATARCLLTYGGGRRRRLTVNVIAFCVLAAVTWAGAVSSTADAQPAGKPARVGFLASGDGVPGRAMAAFNEGLQEFGWVAGQNLVIEHRSASGQFERLPALAAELVRSNVDVIVAVPTPSAVAAKNATSTIPIVMVNAAEPVEVGLIASFARPGGNVTGVSWTTLTIIGKELELLKEAVPGVRRVAILWNPANPAHAFGIRNLRTAAGSLGVQLQLLEIRTAQQLEGAFAAMTRERADAVLVVADGMFNLLRTTLGDLAIKHRLPSMHGLTENVEAGGLMSYAPSTVAPFRRAGFFVDKILKGARPADLPVEQPTKFELVINMRTARALGVTVPQAVLLRADRIIE
jgi:putative ABC transport system substrate-binding protein